MSMANHSGFIEIDKPLTEEELKAKEVELILRENNLREREIQATASEVEHYKAMADLKEEKLTYQCLVGELNYQKAVLIQVCKDIKFEYAD